MLEHSGEIRGKSLFLDDHFVFLDIENHEILIDFF